MKKPMIGVYPSLALSENIPTLMVDHHFPDSHGYKMAGVNMLNHPFSDRQKDHHNLQKHLVNMPFYPP